MKITVEDFGTSYSIELDEEVDIFEYMNQLYDLTVMVGFQKHELNEWIKFRSAEIDQELYN